MNTVHPHPYQSEITQWLSDMNQTIMNRNKGSAVWHQMASKDLIRIVNVTDNIEEIWVGLHTETNKPPQYKSIGGCVVKAGITKLNPSVKMYYVVDLYTDDMYRMEKGILQFWIDRGLVYETKEGALEMAKALLKL